jgi:hypothetical protein
LAHAGSAGPAISHLLVAGLKDLCRQRGLPVGGTKAVLRERLVANGCVMEYAI